MRRAIVLLAALSLTAAACAERNADWRAPLQPFQIADHLYYVGSRDLASYLITTPAGNILINANLASSPPQIRASVEALGLRWADTRILLDSQAHFDHMAGAAQILRETGAKDLVMDGDAATVRTGGHADFAFGSDITTDFPPARVDRVLHDGDTVTLGTPGHGGVTLTAHKTAGHTRGCTTWTLRVHLPGEPATQLRDVVIVGGMAALPGYRLIATAQHPASYPGIAADFAHTFATLHALHCDIFLGAHGVYFDLLAKVARLQAEGPRAFLDPAGYRDAINNGEQSFKEMLARQRAAAQTAR